MHRIRKFKLHTVCSASEELNIVQLAGNLGWKCTRGRAVISISSKDLSLLDEILLVYYNSVSTTFSTSPTCFVCENLACILLFGFIFCHPL